MGKKRKTGGFTDKRVEEGFSTKVHEPEILSENRFLQIAYIRRK